MPAPCASAGGAARLEHRAAVLWVGFGLLAGIVFRPQIGTLLEHLNEFGKGCRTGVVLRLAVHIAYMLEAARRLQNAGHGANRRR